MIKSRFFSSLLLLSAIGFIVSSCSNNDDGAPLQMGAYTVGLLDKADVSIYSGKETLYSTLINKTAANATLTEAYVKSMAVDTGGVEVNLSINTAKEKSNDYIDTKLSIHVRDTTNVEVTIPIPTKKNVNPSREKEKTNGMNEVEDSIIVNYIVADQPLALTVTYETNCILIKTLGINATVLKYLRDTYNDGITFDIWNYYAKYLTNSETSTIVTRESLKSNYLDCSTITFTTDPAKYINAFATVIYYEGKVYGKKDEASGIWTPYIDAECKTELPSEYWTRTEDGKNYLLKTHKCDWDCTVTPPAAYRLIGTKDYNNVYKK